MNSWCSQSWRCIAVDPPFPMRISCRDVVSAPSSPPIRVRLFVFTAPLSWNFSTRVRDAFALYNDRVDARALQKPFPAETLAVEGPHGAAERDRLPARHRQGSGGAGAGGPPA